MKRLKTSATPCVSDVDKVSTEEEMPQRLCNYTDVHYHDHITARHGFNGNDGNRRRNGPSKSG